MKKILAKILAVAVVIGFGYLYVYLFWISPFKEHPEEPTSFILIFIAFLHLILFGCGWILGKILDFITDNL